MSTVLLMAASQATQETGQITPVGMVIIVGLVVIITLGVILDKKKAKKAVANVDKMLEGKKIEEMGNFIVTKERKLVVKYQEPTGGGYEIFSLYAVAYIMLVRDNTTRSWLLTLYDANQKCVKGEKYDSRKKNPASTVASFTTRGEDIALRDFIHRHVPQAKIVGKFFEEK